jgi:mannose-6-phosphate isomerase-like protein (cupin superfamily)
MPHDIPGHVHWHEPIRTRRAGLGGFARPASAWDLWRESEALPVWRGASLARVEDLPRAPWQRLRVGAHILAPAGCEGAWDAALIELPPRGESAEERHVFAEMFVVLEGRGSTETPLGSFEWQEGAIFAVPRNAPHLLVNAASRPALLLAFSTAPLVIGALGEAEAAFSHQHAFASATEAPPDEVEPDPLLGLATRRTALIADARAEELPLDNRRVPGARRLAPRLADGFWAALEELPAGRYARAQRSAAPLALLGLAGEGEVALWPAEAGAVPPQEAVRREALGPHALVALKPGAGAWFHQVFPLGDAALRFALIAGASDPACPPGPPGERLADPASLIEEGGATLAFHAEPETVRQRYAARTASRMEPAWFTAEGEPLGKWNG